jgi:polar amino acid transport system substrate-binding protein
MLTTRRTGLAGALGLALLPFGVWAQGTIDAARAALPDATRASGVLRVATSLQWPPFAFADADGKPDGIDIRLIAMLAQRLGLRAEIEDTKFPTIVPGVSSGRYDVGLNQINITAERAKVVDFVPYSKDGLGLLVRRGTTGMDVNDLCGKTLVLTQGSAQVGIAERLSAACLAAGKKEINFLFYPNSADTYLALANGRGDGFLNGRASGMNIAKTNTKLQMTGNILKEFSTVSGIVVAKGNTAIANALRLSLEALVADGSYGRLLDGFGLAEAALTVEEIRNPPRV